MKKKKYLPLYYELMETGQLPGYGLCRILGDEIKIFEPTLEYSKQIYSWVEIPSDWYWAYSGDDRSDLGERSSAFTPMRQNIILFLAAMNGEL